MTKEQLLTFYGGAWIGDANFEPAMAFAQMILFECAKAVCFNCKDGNPSEPTKDPTHRIHRLGKSGYTEACRATAFFLEGEQ